ncbi:hypothetical protein UPYG_G00303700 [Umbra pygmaea]|uniref:glucuronosyltransferase n=1 Tax=Umbra pygmaea TaxID=75934 RepID=A0ABD0WRX2_UMBPY
MEVTAVLSMCLLVLNMVLVPNQARETDSGGDDGLRTSSTEAGEAGKTNHGAADDILTGDDGDKTLDPIDTSGDTGDTSDTNLDSSDTILTRESGRTTVAIDSSPVGHTGNPEIVAGAPADTSKTVTAVGGSDRYSGRLLVVPMDGSHWVGVKAIAEEMGRRGHQVTVVIPEVSIRLGPSKHCRTVSYPVPYGQETVDRLMDNHKDNIRAHTLPLVERLSQHIHNIQTITSFIHTTAENLLFNSTLISSLEKQGFDAVLTDPLVPTGSLLARRLGLPSVCLLRGIPCGLDLTSASCPAPPSYVPRFFTQFTDTMTFSQRVVNVLEVGVAEVLADSAIWLLRYDFTMEFPRPLMPNMVLVGGINCHVRDPLPKELDQWVSGKDGFIVFSLGSTVSTLPDDITRIFLQAFALIPQKVLWRFTGSIPGKVPENVKMMKWLPQNDLLAHLGAKAFMTHAGTHGLYEGVCHAVPMVMLPLFGDQPDNAGRLAGKGAGVVLDIRHVTVDALIQALDEVVNNTRYKSSLLKLSAIHKDRPIDPLELSVYWTEFVMRNKGAGHLRVAAQDLNWFQYYSLDVICLLVVVVMAVVMMTMKCLLLCIQRFTRKRKQD